ncbi:MAG TPA: AraC family transcriptional regulator [Vicinamibacteria bacterium]|nr:AraC family transcriptional regulator [Vicinamibacteria bacterium]
MGEDHDPSSGALAPESATPEPKGVDALSDVLRAVRLSGALFFVVDATSPWLVEIPSAAAISPLILPGAGHLISYHVVTEGSFWGGILGEPAMRLEAGDVLIVPHGDPYVLSTAKGGESRLSLEENLAFFKSLAAGELPFVLEDGGGGPERLRLVCGFLGCEALPFNPILAALPRLVHVRGPSTALGDRLNRLVEFALDESRENRAGSDCVLLRISELLFIEVVRRHLESLPPEETGWLAGLRDPVVGRALALLHQQPAHPWTLEKLARGAGLSRSALAERFNGFVGQPPMQYLTRWRIQLAAKLLAEDARKVSAVAMEVGYDSEAAFSRAFKKSVGVSPAAWRDRRVRD